MKTTLLVLIAIVVIIVSYAIVEKRSYDRWLSQGQNAIQSLENSCELGSETQLPPLLQQYLKKVLPDFKKSHYVQWEQSGVMRLKREEKMSNFTAQQTVSIVAPMFSWEANINMGGLPVKVCDRLIDNNGELQARLMGAIAMAKASGPEMLRGELLRYLAELPWYPMAILCQPEINWTEIDPKKLQGSMTIEGVTAEVEYRFNETGLIESIFVTKRGMTLGDQLIQTPWLGEFSQYQNIDGVLIPKHGEVSWLLPDDKFTYFKGDIENYSIHKD